MKRKSAGGTRHSRKYSDRRTRKSAVTLALVAVCVSTGLIEMATAEGSTVCTEGTRSVNDVKNAMQPFVDAIVQAMQSGVDNELSRAKIGRLAGRAYSTILVAASRIDAANELEDLGRITSDGERLVDTLHVLAHAISQSNFNYVEPVIPDYNEAQAAFMVSCHAEKESITEEEDHGTSWKKYEMEDDAALDRDNN